MTSWFCPVHDKEENLFENCDNDCRTLKFDCGCEHHVWNETLIKGHDPMCGIDCPVHLTEGFEAILEKETIIILFNCGCRYLLSDLINTT